MWRTKAFTPLFNTPDFFKKLLINGSVDKTFHNRILETILFPKRAISLISEGEEIVVVESLDYENSDRLYTKRSFIEKGEGEERKKIPSKEEILLRLKNFPKIPYLLGGTIPEPIFFAIDIDSRPFENRHKKLFGIDCSGILHYVCNGHTPRNTKDLMDIGYVVQILEPLDLILFPGHVIIYLGKGLCIESRQKDGVTISFWNERKHFISESYKFIRWYPEVSL